MATQQHVHSRFDLDAGDLALDFANTLEGRYDDVPRDLLTDYDGLVEFALEGEALDDAAVATLRSEAGARPEAAAATMAGGIDLREAIFHIFSTLAAGAAPAADDLLVLNGWLARSLPHGAVVPDGDGFAWQWAGPTNDLARPLWPIAYAAMDLLLHGPTDRLRECAADDCGWLFIDTTRNRARRWCSMKSCGNRAKVQQFRERARGSADGSTEQAAGRGDA